MPTAVATAVIVIRLAEVTCLGGIYLVKYLRDLWLQWQTWSVELGNTDFHRGQGDGGSVARAAQQTFGKALKKLLQLENQMGAAMQIFSLKKGLHWFAWPTGGVQCSNSALAFSDCLHLSLCHVDEPWFVQQTVQHRWTISTGAEKGNSLSRLKGWDFDLLEELSSMM